MKGVIVTGALGRMGSITVQKLAEAADLTLAAGVDVMGEVTSLEEVHTQAQVLIDFSHHTAAPAIMNWAAEHHVAVVMCTTGHTPQEQASIRAAAEKIPVFYSANMSVGVALLAELAKRPRQYFPMRILRSWRPITIAKRMLPAARL